MHSYVRFATAAALIAFGGIIGAGAIALVPAAMERIPAIRAEGPPASACDPQTRLPWERNCPAEAASPQQPPLAGTAPREAANAAADVPPPARIVEVPAPARTVEAPPPARTAEVPPPTLTAPQPPVRDNARAAPTRQTAAAGTPPPSEPGPPASAPQAETPPAATPAVTARPPRPPAAKETTLRAPAANETAPRAAATNETTPRDAAAKKKASRQEQAAKRSTNEALGVVRRFGETLPEIPVRSYAPDGTQRTIVIRPTNIQDSYYYSAPR